MTVGGHRTQSRQRCRRIHRLNGWSSPRGFYQRPAGNVHPAAHHEQATRRPERQTGSPVRLLERVVRAITERRVRAKSVKADSRRITPATDQRELPAAMKQTWGRELHLGESVLRNAVAATQVHEVVRTDVLQVTGAERETAAAVCVLKVGMPPGCVVHKGVL